MQRLFSAFPYGSPGWGLLLLRLCLTTYSVTVGLPLVAGLRQPSLDTPAVPGPVGVGLIVLSALAGLGLWTPIANTLIAVIHAFLLLAPSVMPGGGFATEASAWPALFAIVIAISLVLLGPGGFSVDAFVFGRRRIPIPSSLPGTKD